MMKREERTMMKRMICLLLAGCLLWSAIAVAEEKNEITFLDIPWLSDVETVVQQLTEKGYVSESFVADWYIDWEDGFFFRPEPRPETKNVILPESGTYDAVQAELGVPSYELHKKIAGYGIDRLDFAFIMDGESTGLLGVRVNLDFDDFEASYADLKAKLTVVYGKGIHANPYGWDVLYCDVWRGEGDTVVVLMNDNYSISLYYGLLSAEEMLKECYEKLPSAIDSSDYEGL
ncbi:MAG: hypothetical protein IJE07_04075 [Clostridia bacterium]|nr:hypothetical protein [Clostridia bacterium]